MQWAFARRLLRHASLDLGNEIHEQRLCPVALHRAQAHRVLGPDADQENGDGCHLLEDERVEAIEDRSSLVVDLAAGRQDGQGICFRVVLEPSTVGAWLLEELADVGEEDVAKGKDELIDHHS